MLSGCQLYPFSNFVVVGARVCWGQVLQSDAPGILGSRPINAHATRRTRNAKLLESRQGGQGQWKGEGESGSEKCYGSRFRVGRRLGGLTLVSDTCLSHGMRRLAT